MAAAFVNEMDARTLGENGAPELTANGQVAALVIWTDGVPDKKALFVKALEKLQRLPVTITVRLCTSDEALVHDKRPPASTTASMRVWTSTPCIVLHPDPKALKKERDLRNCLHEADYNACQLAALL